MVKKYTRDEIANDYMNSDYYKKEYPTDRRMKNAIDRRMKELETLYNMPLVKEIEVDIDWVKNSTWGMNPHGTAYVTYVNGKTEKHTGFTASGAGYDKGIAVLEHILNEFACQNLLEYDTDFNHGNGTVKGTYTPFYSLGADEGKFLNFNIDHTANGKTYDQYVITFKNPAGTMYAHRVHAPAYKQVRKPATRKSAKPTKKFGYLKNAYKKMI